jgi:cytochrome c-type biogenesis protein CcmH
MDVTLFWFLAGVLTTLATLIAVLPWLRRVPRFGPLPVVPWQASAAAGLSVVAALGLYAWLGRPDLAGRPAPTVAASAFTNAVSVSDNLAAPAPPKSAAGSMETAVAALQARLAKGGGTAADWELLAKSYEFMGRPGDAAKARSRQLPSLPDGKTLAAVPAAASPPAAPTLSADSLQLLAKASGARQKQQLKEAAAIYAQLAARGQMNADGWADYADTAASLQRSKLAGEPESYVAKALALNPQHPKALWLRASADEEAGRFAEAATVWQRLQAVLPEDSADAKIVAANLQQDLKLAGNPAAPAAAAVTSPGTAVSGEVSLAAALSAKAAAGATLFIVAKSVDSPGPPVAVFRGTVATWPVKFTLDDSQSMLPGRNLSKAGRVKIEARISQSGQPMPAAGDLQGSSGIINPAGGQQPQPLKILIDRVIT